MLYALATRFRACLGIEQALRSRGKGKCKSGKGKVLHKAGEALAFFSEDSREMTAWVNALTNVHKALAGR